jgi:hypothetical protein
MKRFLWTTALLLLAAAPYSYAQLRTTTVFQNSFPDNVVSQLIGPGINLTATGGILCDWCFGDNGFSNTPGSSLTPGVGILYDGVFGTLTIEGQTFCEEAFPCFISQESGAGIGASQSLTFPTNGKDFTVTLPAVMGPVEVSSFTPPDGALTTFDFGEFSGEMTLSFGFVPESLTGLPSYYVFDRAIFTSGFAVAEPGPLGLMAAGLAGLLGLVLKRRLPALFESR